MTLDKLLIDKKEPLDLDKISPVKKVIIRDILAKNINTTPLSVFLISLNSRLSTLCCTNRIFTKYNETVVPLNLYTILFLESGGGKDRTLNTLDNLLFKDIYSSYSGKIKYYYELYESRLKQKAIDNGIEGKTNIAEYMRTYSLNYPVRVVRDATAAGLLEQGKTYMELGYGCLNVAMSEFAYFLEKKEEDNSDFIGSLLDVYESGNLYPRALKHYKKDMTVKGIPLVLNVHSSPDNIFENNCKRILDKQMNRGLARRSLLCCPSINEFRRLSTIEDHLESIELLAQDREYSKEATHEVRKFLNEIFKAYEPKHTPEIGAEGLAPTYLTIDKKALTLLAKYEFVCAKKKDGLPKIGHSGVKSELGTRTTKVIRLAGINAILNHPAEKIIYDYDVEQAIYEVEFFGQYLKEYYEGKQITFGQQLYVVLKSSLKPLRTMEIRELDFANKNKFKAWLEDVLEEVKEICESEDEVLIEDKKGNTIYYSITDKIKTDIYKIKLSCSDEMTTGYKLTEMPFKNLDLITNSSRNYSNFEYIQGYRSQANCVGVCNCIIFDFDNGQTIEKVKEKLEDYSFIVTPTRNHQKPKHGKVCDRFRLVLPLESPLNLSILSPKDLNKCYKQILTSICKHFGFDTDTSAHEIGRFYFGNPDTTEKYINEGKLLSWEDFYTKEEAKPLCKIPTLSNSGHVYSPMLPGDALEKKTRTYFAKNYYEGNRNQCIYTWHQLLKQDGLTDNESRETIRKVMSESGKALNDKEFLTATRGG